MPDVEALVLGLDAELVEDAEQLEDLVERVREDSLKTKSLRRREYFA